MVSTRAARSSRASNNNNNTEAGDDPVATASRSIEPLGLGSEMSGSHTSREYRMRTPDAEEGLQTPVPENPELSSIEARHRALVAQVKARRLQEEIEALEEEATGHTPSRLVAIEGVSLPTRKRPIDAVYDSVMPKQIKLSNPPTFAGKNHKELQSYEVGWKNQFRAMPTIPDDEYATRIATAATYLTHTAAEAWARNTTRYHKWDDYMKFLRSIIADPETRKSIALLQLQTKTQRTGQSVRALLGEVENLESDIPKLTEEERSAWAFLNALSPELRTEVIRENKEIKTREQVVASAQRHEEMTKQRKLQEDAATSKPKTSTLPSPAPSRGAYGSRGGRGSFLGRSKDKGKEKEKDEKEVKASTSSTGAFPGKCHHCGKVGHKAYKCPKRDRNGNHA
jgi:hypothetical protein